MIATNMIYNEMKFLIILFYIGTYSCMCTRNAKICINGAEVPKEASAVPFPLADVSNRML